MPPCLTLSIIRYGSRVKWSNPGKGVAPSPTPWCSKLSKREPSGHPRLWSPTYKSFVCTQFMSDSSIWPIDMTLLDVTPPGLSRPGSDSNDEVLSILQSSSITRASPSDCLMSCSGHLLWGRGLILLQRHIQCIPLVRPTGLTSYVDDQDQIVQSGNYCYSSVKESSIVEKNSTRKITMTKFISLALSELKRPGKWIVLTMVEFNWLDDRV